MAQARRDLEHAQHALEEGDYYVPSRYPDAFPSGAPFQYYRLEDAKKALGASRDVLAFCESALSGP